MEVATEILRQLGGNKFIAMTGSKQFCADDDMLIFKIPGNLSKANRVRITLNSMDLYDVEFLKINRKFDIIIIKEYNNVYNEDLQDIFTSVTGLETHL